MEAIEIKGRVENKQKSIERMRGILSDKPDYLNGFYNSLLNPREYLTAQNYTLTVIRFMEYLKSYDLSGFNESNIDCFILSLKGRDGGECSDSFKSTTRAALNKFGQYLVRQKLIEENPVDNIDTIPVKDTPDKISMTPEELRTVLKRVVDNDLGTVTERGRRKKWITRNYAILTLLITTGMRITALTEINVEDYNAENKTLDIIDKRRTPLHYELEKGTYEAIEEWLKVREKFLKNKQCDALFISNRRERITSKTIRDMVSIYTEGMNKHITPHKFRSSFVTNSYEATGDIYMAQKAVGHSRVDTTERYIVSKVSNKSGADIMRKLLDS